MTERPIALVTGAAQGIGFACAEALAEDGARVARRRRVAVRDIPFRPASVELVEGVEDGEEIVITGLQSLRDGLAVRTRAAGPALGTASEAAADGEVGS